MNYKERKAGYAVTRKRLRASIRRLRTDEENRLADENESLRAEVTRLEFLISAPRECWDIDCDNRSHGHGASLTTPTLEQP